MISTTIISDTTIQVTFSNNLDVTTVSVSDFNISSPTGIDITDVSVSDEVVTLTISPALSPNSPATVELQSEVSDISGNVAFTPQSKTDSDGDGVVIPPLITAAAVNNPPYVVTGTSESNSSIEVFEGANSVGNGTADINGDWDVIITTLVDGPYTITAIQNDTSNNLSTSSPALAITIDSSNENTIVYTTPATSTLEIGSDGVEIILDPASSTIDTIILNETATETLFLDLSATTTGGETTAITNGFDITFFTGEVPVPAITTIQNDTVFTGPVSWGGVLELPTITELLIPSETLGSTTITYSDISVFEIGNSSNIISLSEPARIELTGKAGPNVVAFFADSNDNITFITATCNSDIAATALPSGANECSIVVEDDVVIWTDHFTKFGASKRSSSTASTSSSDNGGSGRTGTGPGGAGSGGYAGFTGILSTNLAINEVSYDKCTDNMARILVSSDADIPPTLKVSTAKSGVVYPTLAEVQPYEDLNKFSTVDRYLYEIPISTEESFMMIVATQEIGIISSVVQASVRLLSCEGTTVIVPLPKETLPDVLESSARFFDTKVQIGNNSPIDASQSEFLFINGQELTISSIIDSQTPLQSVELRSITMGQADTDYIAVQMDVTPLSATSSAYAVSGSIPSFFFVEPGMTYWLHITDEDGAQIESIHYNIGAKPTSVPDIAVEVDMPIIKPSGSVVKPEFYLFNEDKPSYGIVSLMVDGEIVSKRSQLLGTGQTQIIFNWNVPNSDGYISYDVQGVVELYDGKITTTSSSLATHPKTVTVSGTDMPALQIVERDGTILADPALVYASDADSTVRFIVTDPQGQCIIGGAEECLVKENTSDKRGGLESVPYGDQILRVKYSGADNALERFSITSIDPIVGQWNVSLESEDGLIPQADASEDPIVKIKYRYHSETVTVYSQ
jgi:hypothetical protein